jgi:hypothetical protein
MAIEDVLRRMESAGYRVNNLFQTSTGRWQANVRDPAGTSYGFGVDTDPERALLRAMMEASKLEVQWFALMRALDRLTAYFEERTRAR